MPPISIHIQHVRIIQVDVPLRLTSIVMSSEDDD